jgi:isopenicillin-N N-acyltransferase like protein
MDRMNTANSGPSRRSRQAHFDVPDRRLVDVCGNGSSRGAMHGEQLRELIADTLERWRHAISDRARLHPRRYVANFLGSTGFVRTVADACPDLFEEVRAIARGSNQPIDDVMVYNFMDEEWRFTLGESGGCSIVGTVVEPDGNVIIGQNMDLPEYLAGSQAILRISTDSDEPDQVVLTAAGMIGLLGVNSAGLACCVNTLNALPCASDGMPVAFIVRRLLRHHDAASAGRHLITMQHASGQHYGIGDRYGLRGYECSANGCVAGPLSGSLLHTNHPLWWTDRGVPADGHPGTTEARLHELETGLDDVRRQREIRTLLSSTTNGLCVLPTPDKRATTFCSAEFTLSVPPAVHVSLGRPSETEWQRVEWA